MSGNRKLWLGIVFVSILFSMIGHNGPVLAQKPEPLKVLSVFPEGEVPRVKQFTVTFDQPMIPLGDMSQAAETSPIEVLPKMAGDYRWLNVYTLVFEPEIPLEGSQAGEIRIKAGTKSLAGAVLADEMTVKYSLPVIAVNRVDPAAGTDNLELKPAIRVYFNQPVNLDDLKSKVHFTVGSQERKVPVEIMDVTEANQDRQAGGDWIAVLSPGAKLPPNSVVRLVAPAGLVSQVGPLPSQANFNFDYRTYGPLTVREISGYRFREDLPYDPESGLRIEFSNPVPVKGLGGFIKTTPEYNVGQVEEGEYVIDTVTSLWLPGPFKPDTDYEFKFLPGLKDVYGQDISGQTAFRVHVGSTRAVLDLVGRLGVLEKSDQPTYPFQARNVKKVFLRGVFLQPDTIIPFINQNKFYDYYDTTNQDFLADLPKYAVKKRQINLKTPKNIMTFEPVDLTRLFGPAKSPGLMYIDLNSPATNVDDQDRPGKTVYQRALVQVTNVGLSVKFGLANTLIWTTDLETGSPLAEVKIEIRDRENTILWRGFSDAQGLALAPGSVDLGLKFGQDSYWQPQAYVLAEHDGQLSLVSDKWNDGISPWNFNLSGRDLSQGEQMMTWVLTSLPLYKPGDEVKFKVIARRNTTKGLLPSDRTPMIVRIKDSRGKEVSTQNLDQTRFGTASGQFTLPDSAPLGQYSIETGFEAESLNYSGSFQVEAYRKPTFAVVQEPSEQTGFSGDKIKVDLTATYHFGSPVKDRPAKYVVTSTPASFSLPGYENYTIQDSLSDPEEPEEPSAVASQGETTLDDKGRASLTFEAGPPKRPAPRDFIVETTVSDVDERTVSQRTSILIHPTSFYLGLKTSKYLVKAGDNMAIDLIAAAPDGKLLPDIEVDLIMYRRTWQTVRRKTVGGYYEYVTKVTDKVVDRLRTGTESTPKTIEFPVEETGYYFLAASAADQEKRTAASAEGFYAFGGGSAGWEHYDHDRIDLVLDKAEYRAGEEAVIMVKSPFNQGTGLLTLERNGVRHQEVFKIEGSSPTLTVKLKKEDSPNIFVSVLLVRGRITDKLDNQGRDPGKPAFKVGYGEIKVKDDFNQLKVETTADRPKYKPGEEVELSVLVTDAEGRPQETEVALIVADEALLQLSSEEVYYPEKLFFSDRPLGVWTADLRLNLIGRRHYGLKGTNVGGGGLGEGGDKFRRRFVSLAFFDPHLVTGEDGRAKVRFKLPDNLTTFKIFAVANDAGDRFGTGSNKFVVSKPLLIKPSLPNFIGVGDQLLASVTVHNQSQASGRAEVVLSGENFTLVDQDRRTVDLAPEQSVEVGFPVKVQPGSTAVFRYQVVLGQEEDAAEYRVPLRYPNNFRTAATYGRLTKKAGESILVPAGSDPKRGDLTLTVSPSLIGNLTGPFKYLADYPYGCLEQKTSMAYGDLVRLKWRQRLGLDEEEIKAAQKRINGYLANLTDYRDYSGGFRFWPGNSTPDPFLTAYVVQFINDAAGDFTLAEGYVLEGGINYLTNTLNYDRWPHYYSEREKQAVSIQIVAVLAGCGQEIAPQLENQYNHRQQMGPAELSLLLAALAKNGQKPQIKNVTKQLFGRAVITSGQVHFEEKTVYQGLMTSKIRTNALALWALLETDPKSPHLIPLARWLVAAQKDGHWGNTQNNALSLRALSRYLEIMEKTDPNFNLAVVFDGREVGRPKFNSFKTPQFRHEFPAGELHPGTESKVDLTLEGQGAAYYTLLLNYAAEKPDLTPVQAGFALIRTYSAVTEGQEPAEKPQTTFQRGDLVKIELTLLVPHGRQWVVLEDRLPAGLEPINFSLGATPQHLQTLLEQGQKPVEYLSRYWYEHLEMGQDRVTVFARQLPEGVYNFSYLARAATAGRFIAPGARAEEMYNPETYGLGQGIEFEIKDGKTE